MAQQSISGALEEVKEMLGDARDKFLKELGEFADLAGKPLEEASKKSGCSIQSMNANLAKTLERVLNRRGEQGEVLSVLLHHEVRPLTSDQIILKTASRSTCRHSTFAQSRADDVTETMCRGLASQGSHPLILAIAVALSPPANALATFCRRDLRSARAAVRLGLRLNVANRL